MRAWEELKNNPHITICEDLSTEWYVDMGVIITKYKKDDRIVIQNTMTTTEYFEEISPRQYDIFKIYGWEIGCLNVNIDVNNSTIDRYKMKLSHNIPDDIRKILESRLEKTENKNEKYIDRLENLM